MQVATRLLTNSSWKSYVFDLFASFTITARLNAFKYSKLSHFKAIITCSEILIGSQLYCFKWTVCLSQNTLHCLVSKLIDFQLNTLQKLSQFFLIRTDLCLSLSEMWTTIHIIKLALSLSMLQTSILHTKTLQVRTLKSLQLYFDYKQCCLFNLNHLIFWLRNNMLIRVKTNINCAVFLIWNFFVKSSLFDWIFSN